MKIGILTFHRAYNCGAMLQAWALKTVLERMGHDVEFPEPGYPTRTTRWFAWPRPCRPILRWTKNFARVAMQNLLTFGCEDVARRRYNAFHKRYLPERRCKESEFGKYYDLLISGSDMIWHVRLAWQRAPMFLGENVDPKLRMITYSVSCGDEEPQGDDRDRVLATLQRFSHISVREKMLQSVLATRTTKAIPVTLDPTVLLDKEQYDRIAWDPKETRPYMYVYTLHASDFVMRTAWELANRLGVELIVSPVYQKTRFRAPKGLVYGTSPERMIGYVKNADYVLASSYHGMIFALLYGKRFLNLRERSIEPESRPAALLNRIGLDYKTVHPAIDIDDMMERLMKEVPASAYEELNLLRKDSLDYLEKAVSNV